MASLPQKRHWTTLRLFEMASMVWICWRSYQNNNTRTNCKYYTVDNFFYRQKPNFSFQKIWRGGWFWNIDRGIINSMNPVLIRWEGKSWQLVFPPFASIPDSHFLFCGGALERYPRMLWSSLRCWTQKKAQPKLRLWLPAIRNERANCFALVPNNCIP